MKQHIPRVGEVFTHPALEEWCDKVEAPDRAKFRVEMWDLDYFEDGRVCQLDIHCSLYVAGL